MMGRAIQVLQMLALIYRQVNSGIFFYHTEDKYLAGRFFRVVEKDAAIDLTLISNQSAYEQLDKLEKMTIFDLTEDDRPGISDELMRLANNTEVMMVIVKHAATCSKVRALPWSSGKLTAIFVCASGNKTLKYRLSDDMMYDM